MGLWGLVGLSFVPKVVELPGLVVNETLHSLDSVRVARQSCRCISEKHMESTMGYATRSV